MGSMTTYVYRVRAGTILTLALASGLLLMGTPLRAGEAPLTRQRVAELIKVAPTTLVARSEAAVSGARVTAAGVLSLENPTLSGLGGVRFNPDGSRPLSAAATVSWPVDTGGNRGARVTAARATYKAAVAAADSEQRSVLLGALLQHALILRDERQVTIAATRHALSERLYTAAQRRRAAGGVPELDVVLAATQEKRDASAKAKAAGAFLSDKLMLLTTLGLSGDPPVQGSLVPAGDVPTLPELVKRVAERAEVRAATAALNAAQAIAARERAIRSPTISLLAQYERDDAANIGLIGFAIPLPVLNANRSEVATAAAEVHAAQTRMTRARTTADGQIRELYARYLGTKAVKDLLAPTAALAARAVSLATLGYELGENDLASVLLVRRETIEAEAALLEAEQAHAAVKIELLVTAGRLPQ